MVSSRSLTCGNLVLLASVLLGSTVPHLGASGVSDPEAAQGSFFMELQGDRLTVRVQETSLRMVLEAIGCASGVEMAFAGPFEEKITASLDNLPLDEGVKQLLRRHSYAFLYTAAGPGQPSPAVLKKVSVFVNGRSARPGLEQSLPQLGRERTLPHPEPATGAEATESLAAADEERVMQELLEVLQQEGDGTARADALSGLAGLATLPLGPLAAIALQDRDPAIRRGALELLGQRSAAEPQIRTVLRDAATADPDQALLESAATLLEVAMQAEQVGGMDRR